MIHLDAAAAARLFLGAQGLLDDPARRTTRAELLRLITKLGFVQVDTVCVVSRAHDLILHARLGGYREGRVWDLLNARALFEAFTHDASLVPAAWYAYWKSRFPRDRRRIEAHPWWQNLLGPHYREVCAHVLARIEAEGPLGSADFEHPEKRGPWWGWKPQKAALDYLWRTGALAVASRRHFHKRYDLPERVLQRAHAQPEPEPAAYLEWACATAAERLVVFTPRELAEFWGAIAVEEARAWCAAAAREGRIAAAVVEGAKGAPSRASFVLADWRARLRHLPAAPDRIRLLAPFDPVIRDRRRCLALFGFAYRFEAFTPEPKRQYGYYVLPILEGERLVGRLDPKLHRATGLLEIKGLWWEPGIRATRPRRRKLRDALEGLAMFVGAREIAGQGWASLQKKVRIASVTR